ncbi:hypothetical protein EVAR_13991_1 [Eumeta japonica]|uniref:Uncharacterized protein n=1 Tax=Eumeta variegata TaxID=151549 RepID=A0A4C1U9D8_EUMVA|nr:hypothetical protein EVAR_13991_1 [Eumeta japonica]
MHCLWCDGRWAGDTWYRRGAPSKAGGPRSVRVCRSLKGKDQRPGLAANHLVDTISCGAWRPAAQRTLDRQGREGRGVQRGGDLHKKRIAYLLWTKIPLLPWGGRSTPKLPSLEFIQQVPRSVHKLRSSTKERISLSAALRHVMGGVESKATWFLQMKILLNKII